MLQKTIISSILFLGFISCNESSKTDKFICETILESNESGGNIVVFIFPSFCGACTEESINIIDSLNKKLPITIISTESYTNYFNINKIIPRIELESNGIIHSSNFLYYINDCEVKSKIALINENKKQIDSLINLVN